MRAALNYFTNNGSTAFTVTLCALDIFKAFDKVDHYVLFSKLVERKVPVCLLMYLFLGAVNAMQLSGGAAHAPGHLQ